jgi:hypothetical protein
MTVNWLDRLVAYRLQRCGLCHLRWTGGVVAAVIFVLTASSCAGSADLISESREVLLVPSLNAGWVGWCVISVDPSFGGCPPGRSRPPILAESWSSGGPPRETDGYAVTTSQVVAVSFDGEPAIPTHAEAALPDGLRGVGLEIRGKSLLEESETIPRFTPLNEKGEVIPRPTEARSLPQGPLGMEVPTRNLRNPGHPTSGACRISAEHLNGLMVGGGSVITRIAAYSGLMGQGFLSCGSTSYNLDGWPLLAGMLLNASHPGSAPPRLAAMRPLLGHPGIFEAPGSEEEEMVARRVHGAWLVVARAKLKQRLSLLEHLRATVHL